MVLADTWVLNLAGEARCSHSVDAGQSAQLRRARPRLAATASSIPCHPPPAARLALAGDHEWELLDVDKDAAKEQLSLKQVGGSRWAAPKAGRACPQAPGRAKRASLCWAPCCRSWRPWLAQQA
jgi:hypothetical protein